MPPKKQAGPRDISDAFLELSEQLTLQASRPNIHGYTPHFKQINFHTFQHLIPNKTWAPCRVEDIPLADLVTGTDGAALIGNIEDLPLQAKENLLKIRLYIGGNRSGKTVGGIVEDIWWVTKTHPFININAIWPEPIRGRVCSVDFTNGVEKIIIPEIRRWCPVSYFRGGSWVTAYDKDTKTLNFENGGFIEFMSYDQDLDKFAGTSRHFIHFDEEPPEDIYVECAARTIDTGGCIWFTLTPVEGMTWIHDKIYEPGTTSGSREDETIGSVVTIQVVEVDMFDNPFVSDDEKRIYVSLIDDEDIEARVHGKFVRRGGLVYKEFDEHIHVIEPNTPSRDYLWAASVDHGYRNPTAWHWHAVNFEGRVITFREHYASGLVVAEHAKAVRRVNEENGRQPDYYVGDPSIQNKNAISGTSVQEEYMRHGVPITLGNNDVQAGIIRVARYLKKVPDEFGNDVPYWLITDNCSWLIWELKRYRWASWAHKRTEQDHNFKEEPQKKDDHACDGIRYFFMSRPDLRAEAESDPHTIMNPLIGGASQPVSSWEALTEKEWTGEPVNDTWSKEYAHTGWQTEEYMGGEW